MAARKIGRAKRVFVGEVLGDSFLVVRHFMEKLGLFEVVERLEKSVSDFDLLRLTVKI